MIAIIHATLWRLIRSVRFVFFFPLYSPKSTKKPARASVGKKQSAAEVSNGKPVKPRVTDDNVNVIPLEESRASSRHVASVATATSEDEMVSDLTTTTLDTLAAINTNIYPILPLPLPTLTSLPGGPMAAVLVSLGHVYVYGHTAVPSPSPRAVCRIRSHQGSYMTTPSNFLPFVFVFF